MRFSKSISRGAVKTGCVCESTKPGEYDLAGAIDLVDMRCFRRQEFVLGDFVGRTDGDDLAVGDKYGAIFDDAEFAHLRAAARAGVAVATQRQKLRSMDEESDGRIHYESALHVKNNSSFT